jgi:hypothetical protein
VGEMRNSKFFFKNLKGIDHLGDLGIDGRIICTKMDLKERECEGVE